MGRTPPSSTLEAAEALLDAKHKPRYGVDSTNEDYKRQQSWKIHELNRAG
jgi:hypothetical protein